MTFSISTNEISALGGDGYAGDEEASGSSSAVSLPAVSDEGEALASGILGMARRAALDITEERSRKRACGDDRKMEARFFLTSDEVRLLKLEEFQELPNEAYDRFSPIHYQQIIKEMTGEVSLYGLSLAPSNWIQERFLHMSEMQRHFVYETRASDLSIEVVIELEPDTVVADLIECPYLLLHYAPIDWVDALTLRQSLLVVIEILASPREELLELGPAWLKEVISQHQLPIELSVNEQPALDQIMNVLPSSSLLNEFLPAYKEQYLGDGYVEVVDSAERWLAFKLKYPDTVEDEHPSPVDIALAVEYGSPETYAGFCRCFSYLCREARQYLFALAHSNRRARDYLSAISRMDVEEAGEQGEACRHFIPGYFFIQSNYSTLFADVSRYIEVGSAEFEHDRLLYSRLLARVERKLKVLEKKSSLKKVSIEQLRVIEKLIAQVKKLSTELPARRTRLSRIVPFMNALDLLGAGGLLPSAESIPRFPEVCGGRYRALELRWYAEHEPAEFVRSRWSFTLFSPIGGDSCASANEAYTALHSVLHAISEDLEGEVEENLDYELLIRAGIHALPCGPDRTWHAHEIEYTVEEHEREENTVLDALCSALDKKSVTLDQLKLCRLDDQMTLLHNLLYGITPFSELEQWLKGDAEAIEAAAEALRAICDELPG